MKITDLSVNDVYCFENFKGEGRIILSWSANIGYGELTLYRDNEDDKWKADTECMCKGEDKEFIRMVLNKWIEGIEVEG